MKSATTSESAGPAAAEAAAASPAARVKVRMYRQGLGDCFLLTFPRGQGRPLHMLIDCGVLQGTQGAAKTMQAVARDIHDVTGGHVDVLAATHEHWDHLSGFLQARSVFDRLTVGAVWLAWTEDPDDPLARRLRGKRQLTRLALARVVQRLDRVGAASAGPVRELLGFFGEMPAAGAAARANAGDALQYLAGRNDAQVRFCRPSDPPIRLQGVPGVRVYVLGPPEDESFIFKSRPSKGEAYEERHLAGELETAFFAAAGHGRGADSPLSEMQEDLTELSFPFDRHHRLSPARAARHPFFKAFYGFGQQGEGAAAAWRRIDNDWLEVAGELALKLDNDTNNTSLVLAIELSEGGDVLLLSGDAQVGSWLSWETLSWPEDGDGRTRTARELLRRTVLYKVGHHASHNATLRDKGLERMEHDEMVAMIPVHRPTAKVRHWNMPFPPLLTRLREKTHGRIIRLDDGVARKPAGVSAAQWQAFRSRVTEDPSGKGLYIECAFG